MFITSASHAAAHGSCTHQSDGSTQYWLVTAETCAATGGMVGLLNVPSAVEHMVATGPGESGTIVVAGSADLTDGAAQPVRLDRGTVLQNRPHGHYQVHAGDDSVQLLTYYGGAVRWSDQTYADAHSEDRGEPAVSRLFDYTDAEDNPFHMPEMGFLHMSARWLIDSTNGGSAQFTLGQSTFAPGKGCHQLHRHPNAEEVFYVWAGEGAHLTAGGGETPMKAGELVFVATNEWHGFRNTGSTPLKAIFGYLGANSLEGGGYELPEISH